MTATVALAMPDAAPAPTAAALARRAAGGDAQAFAALHGRFAGMVHAILVSMLSVDDATDAGQEVFLKVWRGLPALRDPDAVGAWIGTIARNLGRDWLKQRKPALTGLHEAAAVAAPVGDPADAAEILRALRALPEAYRETLAMRLVEGYTGPEIAERTGLTHGSVRVNLTRGMKLLRERLAAEGWA